MSLRPSRRLQNVDIDVSTGDLLALWFEVNGHLLITSADDLGSLALVAQKYRGLVAETVTHLHLTAAQLAAAQQQLQWQQLHSQGLQAASSGPSPTAHVASSNKPQKQQQQQPGAAQQRHDEALQQQQDEAQLPSNAIAHLSNRMPNLSKLTLLCNTIIQARALGAQLSFIAGCSRLTSLVLDDAASCSLPSSGLAHISRLTNFQQLNVRLQSVGHRPGYGQGNSIWQANLMRTLGSVSVLTGLKQLQLRFICGERGYLFSDALLPMVRPLTQLTSLDLAYIDLPPGGLTALSGLHSLVKCVLYGRLSKVEAQDFTILRALPSLQRMELFHDCPSHLDMDADGHHEGAGTYDLEPDEKAELVQVLTSMSHLTWLNMPMCAGTLPLLPLLGKLPALQQLYLQNVSQREVSTIPLGSGCVGRAVRVLQVDNIQVGPEDVDKLAALTQLESLTLFNLQLQDLGSMHALSKLSMLTQLQQFSFDGLVLEDAEHTALFDNIVIRGHSWWDMHQCVCCPAAASGSAQLL